MGHPVQPPLPKQGHLQQAAQDRIQVGFEYLQRSRLHNLPGQPGPVLRHPQREEVLPHVQVELPMLQFVPVKDENIISMISHAHGQSGTSSLPVILPSLCSAVMQTIQIYVLRKLNPVFYPMSMK